MSTFWFAMVTPLVFAVAGLFIYVTTSHFDRRDRERAHRAERTGG